eukprot:2102412-Prorocentrum_lima.AAC.1
MALQKTRQSLRRRTLSMVLYAWRQWPVHFPGQVIHEILAAPRFREATLQFWSSRLRVITNKQLYQDRDDWLSSLSQAAVEGTEKQ